MEILALPGSLASDGTLLHQMLNECPLLLPSLPVAPRKAELAHMEVNRLPDDLSFA
jgi:hypothetical protein